MSRWLRADHLEEWARHTGFIQRQPRKLTASLFVQAAVLLVSQRAVSLSRWAALLGILGGLRLAKQSLWERLDAGALGLLEQVLAWVLGQRSGTSSQGLQGFGRVLLQDSTTLCLAPRLARGFAGSSNQHGNKHGQLKIQVIYDLLAQRFLSFGLSGFNRNDQAASADVLAVLQPGDLVLRDLGYFVIETLERITQAGAFFVSRLRSDTQLRDPKTGQPLDLLKALRRQSPLDQPVLVGAAQIPLRVVALPLAEGVAEARRRRARANRDRRCRPSPRHLALLGWAIYVTNVPAQRLTAEQVAKIYGWRWRIETIFKAWKSHFALTQLPQGSEHQLLAVVYARLIFISALVSVWEPGGSVAAQAAKARPQSLLKVAGLLSDFLLILCAEAWGLRLSAAWIDQWDYHGRYERRTRCNFTQKLMELS